jgi:hypothetical protein
MPDPSEILAVSRTAQRLASGYYAFLVAQLVAANPHSINSLPREIGEIKRKDGTAHTLNLHHYLDLFRRDHDLQREVLRGWAIGALLTLGDELSVHYYFEELRYWSSCTTFETASHMATVLVSRRTAEIGWLGFQLITGTPL